MRKKCPTKTMLERKCPRKIMLEKKCPRKTMLGEKMPQKNMLEKRLPKKKTSTYLAASFVLAVVEKLDCTLCLWLQLSSVGHLDKNQISKIKY